MPLYDYKCPECSREDEILLKLAELDEPISCECGGSMVRKVSPVALHGILFSNVRVLGNGDFVATSNKEVRDYEAQTGMVHVDPSDSAWQGQKYRARDKAENMVNRMGFSSLGSYREQKATGG